MILFYVSVNETIVLKARIKWRKGGIGERKRKQEVAFGQFYLQLITYCVWIDTKWNACFADLENEGKVVVPLLKALCEAIEDKVSNGRSYIEKMRNARQSEFHQF